MKRNSKLIIALALVLVLSLSCLSLIGCSKKHVCESKCEVCGKCTDLECDEKACTDKCQGHNDPTPGPSGHVCAHKCETCGKCTDETCTDDACKSKCQGHEDEYISIPVTGEVRYDLGVIKGFASIANVSVTKDNCEEGESCVTDFSWDKNSSVTMEIWSNAEEDVEGDLVIKVRRTVEVITLTSQISVEVNGDVLESDAQVPSSLAGETASFAEVNLGKFWLTPGKNVIIVKPQSNINNFDFSAIIFYSTEEANLQWYALHEIEGTLFNGTDEHVAFDGDYKVNLAENCLGVGGYGHASATFPVYSSREAKAKIYLVTNSMPADYLVTDYFNWTINDVKISSTAKMPYHYECWGNYAIVEVGEYVLDGGLNNIKLDVSDAVVATGAYTNYYNLRGIIIDTDAKIGFEEQTAEAHVCISVCPDCGGCLDEDCTEDACATKCDCAHKCESVCDVCGGCLNETCEEEVCKTKCDCKIDVFKLNGSNVTIEGQTYNAKEDCVATHWDGTQYQPVTTTYKLNAAKAGKVKLYFTVSRFNVAGKLIGDAYDLTINGNSIESEAQYVAGTPWADYDTIYVGTYDLLEGNNVIVICYSHADKQAGGNLNFRSISLEHSESNAIVFASRGAVTGLSVEQQPSKLQYGSNEKFDATDLQLKVSYEDGTSRVIYSGFTYDENLTEGQTKVVVSYSEGDVTKTVDIEVVVSDPKTKYTFYGNDSRVGLSSAWLVRQNIVDNAALNQDNVITYKLKSDRAAKADLFVSITTWDSVRGKLTDIYRITVNGTPVSSDVNTPIGGWWGDPVEQLIGTIDLLKGENTIVITYNPADWMTLNFSHIALNTSAQMEFFNDAPVLSEITVKQAKKTEYVAGEAFDTDDFRIIATYEDGTSRQIGYGYEISSEPLTEGQMAITVSYTENGVTKTVELPITVTAAAE